MDNNFSLELPEVINPHLALDTVRESFPGKIHIVSSVEELESLQLPHQQQFLLLVNLNSVKDALKEENIISLNGRKLIICI